MYYVLYVYEFLSMIYVRIYIIQYIDILMYSNVFCYSINIKIIVMDYVRKLPGDLASSKCSLNQ